MVHRALSGRSFPRRTFSLSSVTLRNSEVKFHRELNKAWVASRDRLPELWRAEFHCLGSSLIAPTGPSSGFTWFQILKNSARNSSVHLLANRETA